MSDESYPGNPMAEGLEAGDLDLDWTEARSPKPRAASGRARSVAIFLNRGLYRASRRWYLVFFGLTGLWVITPWLAPVFMKLGWSGLAGAIYAAYSFQCHQLPQRSFFLFGPEFMLSLDQIRMAWRDTLDPLILRQFVGSAELGYKLAWSDRMVSAYTSIPLAGLLWWPLRRRLRPLPLWAFALLALPMAIDAGSHFVSDLVGIDQGFRYANHWLATLTGNAFPQTFYAGNALGSFNSWMRLITGVLFGAGLAWFALPYLEAEFSSLARQIEAKFARAGVRL